MTDTELLQHTQSVVLGGGLALGLAFGALAHLGRFCTMGAMADAIGLGNWLRLRAWAIAAATAVVGTQALILLDLIPRGLSLYESSRLLWASHIVGAFLFGVGMVLASGCGVRTLVRIGEGSLKAVVVLLVMVLSALLTIRGVLAVLRASTLETWFVALPHPQTLGLSLSPAAPGLGEVVGMGLAVLMALLALGRGPRLPAALLLSALGIGGVVALGWFVTGHLGYLPEHPLTLEPAFVATHSRGPESLTFVGPPALALEHLLYFSDGTRRWSFGTATIVGVVLGAALMAGARGRFRWDGFRTTQDLSHHLVGGALMGIGGVVAGGCTVGHGLTGISMLSLGSLISIAGMALGAWAALRWLEARG